MLTAENTTIRQKKMFFRVVNKVQPILGQKIRTLCSTNEPYTKISFQDGIAAITMCHSQSRNSLSMMMMQDLIAKIGVYESQPEVRVIILGAEGPVFSSGHNLKELSLDIGLDHQIKIFTLASKLMYQIIDCPLPIIAKVDGVAAAAGCQLVAQCDMAFCSERSTFSTPGANFGIFCSTPGIALARCVPKMTAMKMLLTGVPITSQEAEAKGLVTKVCNNLDEDVKVVCDAIKSKSRSVIEMGKTFYYKQVQSDLKKAYALGEQVMVTNLNTNDGKEGIRSFMEKRKPIWKHR